MFKKIFKKRKGKVFDLSPEQDEFLGCAIKKYNESVKKYNEGMKFGDFDKWAYDQFSGRFLLKNNGKTIIDADAQIIGSYHPPSKSWEWAWNNPNIEESAKIDSAIVKEYGDKEKIWYFSDGKVPVLMDDQAVYFAAVGMKITESQAIYPGRAGDLTVYLLLKNIKQLK